MEELETFAKDHPTLRIYLERGFNTGKWWCYISEGFTQGLPGKEGAEYASTPEEAVRGAIGKYLTRATGSASK